jgi:mannosyltransferase OCH1-like enzyme
LKNTTIYTTWKRNTFPDEVDFCISSHKRYSAGFELVHFDDERMYDFMRDLDIELFEAFEKHPTGILRSDIFRMALLFFKGGIYLDVDIELLRPISELIQAKSSGLARFDTDTFLGLPRENPFHEKFFFGNKRIFSNHLIIAPASGNHFLELYLKEIIVASKTLPNSHILNPLTRTGPQFITRLCENQNVDSVQELPFHWCSPLPSIHEKNRWTIPSWACESWKQGQLPVPYRSGVKVVDTRERPFMRHYYQHIFQLD